MWVGDQEASSLEHKGLGTGKAVWSTGVQAEVWNKESADRN